MNRSTDARRRFLRRTAQFAAAGLLLPFTASARASLAHHPAARQLAFHHTHTGERLSIVYALGDEYLPQALAALNHLLRDHYSGAIGRIDPRLFDLLYDLQHTLGVSAPYHVISGYRCAETNAYLKASRGGGVARRSLHMEGRAIDIRLPGVPLAELRDAALSLRQGGVGFYPREQFVHVDTGRVRAW